MERAGVHALRVFGLGCLEALDILYYFNQEKVLLNQHVVNKILQSLHASIKHINTQCMKQTADIYEKTD